MASKTKTFTRALFAATAIHLFAAPAVLAGEVTVWFWDTKFNGAAMQEAANRYKAVAPDTTITLVDLAKADLETKLQTQFASGVTDGLPDIVLIDIDDRSRRGRSCCFFAPLEAVWWSPFKPISTWFRRTPRFFLRQAVCVIC